MSNKITKYAIRNWSTHKFMTADELHNQGFTFTAQTTSVLYSLETQEEVEGGCFISNLEFKDASGEYIELYFIPSNMSLGWISESVLELNGYSLTDPKIQYNGYLFDASTNILARAVYDDETEMVEVEE